MSCRFIPAYGKTSAKPILRGYQRPVEKKCQILQGHRGPPGARGPLGPTGPVPGTRGATGPTGPVGPIEISLGAGLLCDNLVGFNGTLIYGSIPTDSFDNDSFVFCKSNQLSQSNANIVPSVPSSADLLFYDSQLATAPFPPLTSTDCNSAYLQADTNIGLSTKQRLFQYTNTEFIPMGAGSFIPFTANELPTLLCNTLPMNATWTVTKSAIYHISVNLTCTTTFNWGAQLFVGMTLLNGFATTFPNNVGQLSWTGPLSVGEQVNVTTTEFSTAFYDRSISIVEL